MRNYRFTKQDLFREIVLGTLIYSVVLGFFNDHSSLVTSRSYGITFLVATVLEILTYLSLSLERYVTSWFKKREGKVYKYAHVFSVWVILFLSKFIFLEVLDLLFKTSIYIKGFVGILVVVLVMVVAKQLIDFTYNRLAD